MTSAGTGDAVLSYAEKPARVSRLAVISLGAAVAGAVLFFLVLPPLVGLVLGVVAGKRIGRNPRRLAGAGYAASAVTISLCTFCLSLIAIPMMLPSSRGPSQFGGVAAGRVSPMLMRDAAPFDVVMYPIRNAGTGGM